MLDKDTIDTEFLDLSGNHLEIQASDYDDSDVIDVNYIKIACIKIKRN